MICGRILVVASLLTSGCTADTHEFGVAVGNEEATHDSLVPKSLRFANTWTGPFGVSVDVAGKGSCTVTMTFDFTQSADRPHFFWNIRSGGKLQASDWRGSARELVIHHGPIDTASAERDLPAFNRPDQPVRSHAETVTFNLTTTPLTFTFLVVDVPAGPVKIGIDCERSVEASRWMQLGQARFFTEQSLRGGVGVHSWGPSAQRGDVLETRFDQGEVSFFMSSNRDDFRITLRNPLGVKTWEKDHYRPVLEAPSIVEYHLAGPAGTYRLEVDRTSLVLGLLIGYLVSWEGAEPKWRSYSPQT